jgi:phosphoserine phosphatase
MLQLQPPMSAGIPALVSKLQAQGKGVFLVSGGFRQVIHPIAESLGIPVGNVFANNLLFKVGMQSFVGCRQ